MSNRSSFEIKKERLLKKLEEDIKRKKKEYKQRLAKMTPEQRKREKEYRKEREKEHEAEMKKEREFEKNLTKEEIRLRREAQYLKIKDPISWRTETREQMNKYIDELNVKARAAMEEF